MKVLITGGTGFVGHHFVEHILKNTDWKIVILDRLNYASSGFDRLRDIKAYDDNRIKTLSTDFSSKLSEGVVREIGAIQYIFHLGAETHVDNSIISPEPFVLSNVMGTLHVLNLAKGLHDSGILRCMFYFSTDEVFGPAPDGVAYCEDDPHNPSNPYAATKSGGEMLVKSYRTTYNLPAIITRSMNIFGERQYLEKFLPKIINAVLDETEVIIHANKNRTKAGSRFYIHARNIADAYLRLVDYIEEGHDEIKNQDFHISGEKEIDNLELAQFVAKVLGKKLKYQMVDFHSSRPGHDMRYALDDKKIRNVVGWSPEISVWDSLENTINWSILPENVRWLKP